jgi:hypothetical protein
MFTVCEFISLNLCFEYTTTQPPVSRRPAVPSQALSGSERDSSQMRKGFREDSR